MCSHRQAIASRVQRLLSARLVRTEHDSQPMSACGAKRARPLPPRPSLCITGGAPRLCLSMRALLILSAVLLALSMASLPAQAQKRDQGGSVGVLSGVSSPVIDIQLEELWWQLGTFVVDP